MTGPVRILFVDDHTLFRESVVRLLESEPALRIVAHCATLAEARRALLTNTVDLILLDYDLGAELGTGLLAAVAGSHPRILMVTGGMEPGATLEAVQAGISGIVLKHSDPRQLIEAIHRVAAGETWWDTGILHTLGSQSTRTAPQITNRSLTMRQRQVLHCILDGLSNKEIAARMQSSETAIKASIQELFTKAGVRTRSQLVRIAVEKQSLGWLKQP